MERQRIAGFEAGDSSHGVESFSIESSGIEGHVVPTAPAVTAGGGGWVRSENSLEKGLREQDSAKPRRCDAVSGRFARANRWGARQAGRSTGPKLATKLAEFLGTRGSRACINLRLPSPVGDWLRREPGRGWLRI